MEEGETEFGFHIWEHKPMIVSTIEEGLVLLVITKHDCFIKDMRNANKTWKRW